MTHLHRYAIAIATAASGLVGYAGQALAHEGAADLLQLVAVTLA